MAVWVIVVLVVFIVLLILLIFIFGIILTKKKKNNTLKINKKKCKNNRGCSDGLVCVKNFCVKEDRNNDEVKARKLVIKDKEVLSETLSEEKEDYFVTKNKENVSCNCEDCRKPEIIEDEEEINEVVVDATNYSNYLVYLSSDGTILLEDEKSGIMFEKNSNINIQKIGIFDGYLYGLSGKKIYQLDNNTLEKERWIWKNSNIKIGNIKGFSSTLDGRNMWIGCGDEGYLLDTNFKVIERVSDSIRRVYGYDKNNYIIFENNGYITVVPGGERYKGVQDAVLNHKNEIFILWVDQEEFSNIKILNRKVYYM